MFGVRLCRLQGGSARRIYHTAIQWPGWHAPAPAFRGHVLTSYHKVGLWGLVLPPAALATVFLPHNNDTRSCMAKAAGRHGCSKLWVAVQFYLNG